MKKKSDNKNILGGLMMVMLSLIFVMLLIAGVSALGITPGRTTIDYQAGLEKEIEFSVINNEHSNMQVMLTVQGELNQSVTLFENLIDFLPSEESKTFKYKFKMPDDIGNTPGLHTVDIIALQVPKADSKGTFVGATVAVVSQLYIYVPYPGKYLDSDINILDAELNSTATFVIPVINRGKVGIGSARALVDIYTSMNEKIESVESDDLSVDAGARTELSAKWNIKYPVGNYIAKVTLLYDGESKSFEKPFGIGEQALTIESILVNNFQLGEIAKLQILVENKWNQEMKSVFANLLVYNDEKQVMSDIKSASEDIPEMSKKELIAYWDTVGVGEGEYSGKLMVKYGQKSTDKNLVLKVSENSLDVVGVGYAIRPSGGKGMNMTTILFVLVIILVIINLAWFVFWRRSVTKKGRKD